MAINPNRQLAQVRNAERRSEINSIYKALEQYLIDTRSYPTGITTAVQDICINGNTTNCVNLGVGVLVPDYIAAIPIDPGGGAYQVARKAANNRVSVIASNAEIGQGIFINVGPYATGGDLVYTINVSGTTYRVHEFKTVGTSSLNVMNGGSVEYLVVAGGGGAGSQNAPSASGNNGGSGGGGSVTAIGPASGGLGNTPSTSPSQGNNGGSGSVTAPNFGGGGGGGAGSNGANGTSTTGGNGGIGTLSSITGASIYYAGGGGGGSYAGGTAGLGANGGGGAGTNSGSSATDGTANTGGGGGGNGASAKGGNGGSGIVIVRYPIP